MFPDPWSFQRQLRQAMLLAAAWAILGAFASIGILHCAGVL